MVLDYIVGYSEFIYDMVLVLAFIILPIELIIDYFKHKLTRRKIVETVQSFFSLIPYGVTEIMAAGLQLGISYGIASQLNYQIPISWYSFLLAILFADFFYYLGHRIGHTIRMFWASHNVHHNSPEFNIATAFRFSPLDPFTTAVFSSVFMAFIGFHPFMIVAADIIVLAYQFWIHSEYIPKLGFIDLIFNTPSNHRVHHSKKRKECDSNYAGILMIWDHLFGTYVPENGKIEYGIPKQLFTNNPIKVWFYELYAVFRDFFSAEGIIEKFKVVFGKPDYVAKGCEKYQEVYNKK